MSLACCFFCLFRSARAVSRALKRLAKSLQRVDQALPPRNGLQDAENQEQIFSTASSSSELPSSARPCKFQTHDYQTSRTQRNTAPKEGLMVHSRHRLQGTLCWTPKAMNRYFRQPHLRNEHHQRPASSKHTTIKLLGRSVTGHPKKASWFIAGIACKERYAGRRKP